jgi:hypothetical protein
VIHRRRGKPRRRFLYFPERFRKFMKVQQNFKKTIRFLQLFMPFTYCNPYFLTFIFV